MLAVRAGVGHLRLSLPVEERHRCSTSSSLLQSIREHSYDADLLHLSARTKQANEAGGQAGRQAGRRAGRLRSDAVPTRAFPSSDAGSTVTVCGFLLLLMVVSHVVESACCRAKKGPSLVQVARSRSLISPGRRW